MIASRPVVSRAAAPRIIAPQWVALNFASPADLDGAGVYFWQIGQETYVGKATRLRSRLREYLNNARKLELSMPYRKSNPAGFRRVHLALDHARRTGIVAHWTVIETCAPGLSLLDRERHHIAQRHPTLNGPPRRQEGRP